LAFLGINLLILSGNALNTLGQIFGPLIVKVLSMFGYSTGQLIDTTADVSSDAAKLGVDIANGTVHSIGDLLKNSSKGGMDESDREKLDRILKPPSPPANCPKSDHTPEPDKSSNAIQNPITAKKSSWCLVGEDDGVRGCVAIEEHDKCMSGQIFPTKEACLNPNTKPPADF
jgi:hypothetical protein